MANTPPKSRRTRLSPAAREAMILEAAVEFFAANGFGAQTRELARRLEISEPLIYNYFATKDELIQRVYRDVIETRWDVTWVDLLRDRAVPLRERLVDFYRLYLDRIDDEVWIRIVMYASLDGLDMTRDYITGHVAEVMRIIRDETSVAMDPSSGLDPELVWHLQSTFIYYLIRKHIHRTVVPDDRAAVVTMAVDAFLGSVRAAGA